MRRTEREDAIDYLERKDKLDKPYKQKERKFTNKETKEIEKVMKKGKIYGDPTAEIQW